MLKRKKIYARYYLKFEALKKGEKEISATMKAEEEKGKRNVKHSSAAKQVLPDRPACHRQRGPL